jgi:hypothetical protein
VRARACWVACVLWSGCDGEVMLASDAGISWEVDGGSGETDAGADGGVVGPVECELHLECADFDPCTLTACERGRCVVAREPGCDECDVDSECDDGYECTIDRCRNGGCSWDWLATCECEDASHCDDSDPTTTDRCEAHTCQHDRRSCTADSECDDAVACTLDTCTGGFCASERTPACDSSCPDNDRDGHGSRWCFGGSDCDDFNPMIHPGAAENCSDTIDNDCDGQIDRIDDACGTGGETCATARPLIAGMRLEGAVRSDRTSGTEPVPCGTPNFFTMTLTETSDVDVTVTLEEPPPPAPVPGCPECSGDRMWQYWYRLFFETACGDTTTDLAGAGSYCQTFSDDGFFGGTGTTTLRLRRVPAGTYTVELQAKDQFAWMPIAIEYTIEATVSPSAMAMCGGAGALNEGVTVRADTSAGTNAFGTDCNNTVADVPESIHRFTLAERRRVRIEAVGVADATTGVVPGVRVGLYGTCDPASARADCLEHTGGDCHPRATLERILDPGEHWVVVERAGGGNATYDLTIHTEVIDAACAGAIPITASGSWSGNTTGATDTFRDHRVCGDGYGPDVVYRVDVAAPSRVVLDLIGSYDGEMLTLYRGCGQARLAGGRTSTRVDTMLEPGTYYAVVGGAGAMHAGSYVLNATFVPSGE